MALGPHIIFVKSHGGFRCQSGQERDLLQLTSKFYSIFYSRLGSTWAEGERRVKERGRRKEGEGKRGSGGKGREVVLFWNFYSTMSYLRISY